MLLDIGCAEADNTRSYLGKARHIFALDFNVEFITKAKKGRSFIKFVVSKSEHLPFKNNCFNAITLTEVLEHVIDEQKTLDEIYRVLKPSGKLILSVPFKGLFYFLDPDNFKFYFPEVYNFFYRLIRKRNPKKSSRFSKNVDFHKHYSLDEVKNMLNTKFNIISIYRKSLLLFPLSIWLRYFLSILMLNKSIFMFIVRLIGDADFLISYGRFSYSLIIIATKNKEKKLA